MGLEALHTASRQLKKAPDAGYRGLEWMVDKVARFVTLTTPSRTRQQIASNPTDGTAGGNFDGL
jgi:hypothetical protein